MVPLPLFEPEPALSPPLDVGPLDPDEPRGAALMSGSGGGGEPPSEPWKVGFEQLLASSAFGLVPLSRPTAFMISFDRFGGRGEYPILAMFTCPSHAM